jgi:cytochrome c biogenesis protein
MATTETDAKAAAGVSPAAASAVKPRPRKGESILDKALGLLSSVKFGVTMLMILLVCSIIGMLVVQQDADGFRDYYALLLPAQKLVYGKLDFFNIYHSFYFTLLLAITGLNIILASIDRFPAAWQYIRKPKRNASPNFIRAQMFNSETELDRSPEEAAESVRLAWKKRGLRASVSEENGRITVFGQRNSWNRIGAYFVHVALITIFTGGFLTNRYGVGGIMDIMPGQTFNTFQRLQVRLDKSSVETLGLPFSIECTDIQQQLIKQTGGLDAGNTVDWLSYINIKDKEQNKEIPALVHLNEPFDYRGYRIFQLKYVAEGNAREIKLRLEPAAGGPSREVTIRRNQTTDVEGIGKMAYTEFYPDFQLEGGKPSSASPDYNNPVAMLTIAKPGEKPRGTLAMNPAYGQRFYSNASQESLEPLLIDGNKVFLESFEKAPRSHQLAVQYDPGRKPVYTGFVMLIMALCSVFFFAHHRMWAVIEPGARGARVFFGGNTNRNRPAFEGRFNSLVEAAIETKGARDE